MSSVSGRPTDDEIVETVKSYSSSLYKICLMILRNASDAEDAVQDAFIKYITKNPGFQDEEHKRAWLTKVAVNIAKDKRRYNSKHDHLDFDALEEFLVCKDKTEDEIDIPELINLPEKNRRAVCLHFIEGFSVAEIAKIEGITVFAAKQRLQRGKALLKKNHEVK